MNRMFSQAWRSHCSLRFFVICTAAAILAGAIGCTSSVQRPQLNEKRALNSPDSLQLVGDLAKPWGMKWVEVEGVSLTVGLDSTGSNPAPSADYKMLLSEMQVRQVDKPESVLASESTALTIVRALIPPGAQKGDRVDVEVRVPAKSETASLDQGWLMLTRLKEFARINGRLSAGHVMAMAQGDILVDSLVEGSDDPVMKTRGRVLGGGVVTKSRELGLRIRNENLTVKTSALVGAMINRRFHLYDHGEKKGVANPQKDSFIALVVHPRYRDNLMRYIRVIENIPVRESSADLVQRLQVLQTRLLNPGTSAQAAVQLEAIGSDGIPVLLEGVRSANPEIRFYAAEALAYLDEPSAAKVLSEAIVGEPAFRWRAFRALGAMDDLAAQDALAMLIKEQSAETRYAAFRTLSKLSPDDPMVRGKLVGEEFRLHAVQMQTSPMVHVSKSDRPEIVVFGQDVKLLSPLVAFAGKQIVVKSTDDDRVLVRRLSDRDDGDRQRVVQSDVAAVIEAIVEMGGGYSDVVQVLDTARSSGSLKCRLEFGAVPQPGRKFKRDKEDSSGNSSDEIDISKGAPVELSRLDSPLPRNRGQRDGATGGAKLAPVVQATGLLPPEFDDDFSDMADLVDEAALSRELPEPGFRTPEMMRLRDSDMNSTEMDGPPAVEFADSVASEPRPEPLKAVDVLGEGIKFDDQVAPAAVIDTVRP